ncbi:MAG: leucine-rich repeat protein [Coprococcus sp.]
MKHGMRFVVAMLIFAMMCSTIIPIMESTVYAEENQVVNEKWLEDCTVVSSGRYTGNMGDSFVDRIGANENTRGCITTDGVSYEHGVEAWISRWNFTNESSWAYATYKIDGSYDYLEGKIKQICSYNTKNYDSTLYFFGDNNLLLASYQLLPGQLDFDISVDIRGVSNLKVYVKDNKAVAGGTSFGIVNAKLVDYSNIQPKKSLDEYEYNPDDYITEPTEPQITEEKWLEDCTVVSSGKYTGNAGDSFVDKIGVNSNTRGRIDINGNSYEHGLEAWIARWNFTNENSWAYTTYKIEGFEFLKAHVVQIRSYNTKNYDSTLYFYGDDSLLASYQLLPGQLDFDISVDVTGVSNLKVYVKDNKAVAGGTSFGIVNAKLINYEDEDPCEIKNKELVFSSDFHHGDIKVNTKWGYNLFNEDARTYNSNLAITAVCLAKMAYNPDNMQETMEDLGFTDGFKMNGERITDYKHPLAYFGLKKINIADTDYNVFCVVVRGTSVNEGDDLMTDILDGATLFDDACNNTRMDLINFMQEATGKTVEELKDSNNIVFLSGHSLGGAVANRLAGFLGDFATMDNVFAYTFEPPHTVMGNLFGINLVSYFNGVRPHNFINVLDIVPNLPPWPGSSTYGNNILFNSNKLSNEVFKLLAENGNVAITPFWESGILGYHSLDLDLVYILQAGADAESLSAENYAKSVIKVACPVDIKIVSEDIVVCETHGEYATNNFPDIAQVITYKDEKYVFIGPDEEVNIEFVGTDNGTMEYTVFQTDSLDGELKTIKQYENVELSDGKQFVSTVNTAIVDSDSLSSETKLFNVSGVDGLLPNADTAKEIDTEGKENILITENNVEIKGNIFEYSGKAITPEVVVSINNKKLKKDTDFTVNYQDNIEEGEALAVITGKNDYSGTVCVSYSIVKASGDADSVDSKGGTPGDVTGKTTDKSSKKHNNGNRIVEKGETDSSGNYKAISSSSAQFAPVKINKKNVTILDTVVIDGVKVKVVSIADRAFENNSKIEKVTIGKNVKIIGKNAFSGAKRLSSVSFKGKGLTTIGANAFKKTNIKVINLYRQSNLKSIGPGAFEGCKRLRTMNVAGSKLKTIGKNSFKTGSKIAITLTTKNKKSYNALVKKFKKAGAKKSKYKYRKAR